MMCATAFLAGCAFGVFAMAFIVRATRCEGCCQKNDEIF